jgi:hypothetical protein
VQEGKQCSSYESGWCSSNVTVDHDEEITRVSLTEWIGNTYNLGGKKCGRDPVRGLLGGN